MVMAMLSKIPKSKLTKGGEVANLKK